MISLSGSLLLMRLVVPADPPELVAEIKHAIDDVALQKPDALAAFDRNPFQGIYSLTSIEPEEDARVIPKMLGWQPALDALKTAGVTNPRFSSGFSLSKPAGGPALYWHRCAAPPLALVEEDGAQPPPFLTQ